MDVSHSLKRYRVCKLRSEATSEDKDQDNTKPARIHRMRFTC